MDIENYIKDLPPELQEKARACGSVEELLALAKDAKIPIPDEALAAVAGGNDQDVGACGDVKCPKCGSKNVKVNSYSIYFYYKCNDCGHEWKEVAPI